MSSGSGIPGLSIAAALGQQLKYCRVGAQYDTQTAFGEQLGVHSTLVTKAETGAQVPSQQLFKTWLDTCGTGGQLRSAIEGMWIVARNREAPGLAASAPWYESESKAHTLRYWGPLLIPGVVQTPGYARALYAVWGHDAVTIEELTEQRMERQAVLDRFDPPDITIVLWEPVLHNLIGDPETMRDQLAFLLKISERPNVSLHVFQARGANMGLQGSINLAAADDVPEALLIDAFQEDSVTTEAIRVRKASATFNTLRGDSLNRADTRKAVSEAMETWDKLLSGSPATAEPQAPPTALRPETSSA